MRIKYLCILFGFLFNSSNGFKKIPCLYRRMRIKYKLMVKHNDPIIQSKEDICK